MYTKHCLLPVLVVFSTVSTQFDKKETIKCFPTCDVCTSAHSCSVCKPGYYGRSYGMTCHNRCSSHCKQKVCDMRTGECESCTKGWYGRFCERPCHHCSGLKNYSCTQYQGTCIAEISCDNECKPGCLQYCEKDTNPSDGMRNTIYILTGLGGAVCVALVFCCAAIVLRRKRRLQTDTQMEIMPSSQKLIERTPTVPYTTVTHDSSRSRAPGGHSPRAPPRAPSPRAPSRHIQFSPDNRLFTGHTDNTRGATFVMHDAVADIGVAIPLAPPTLQDRGRAQHHMTEPPPSYQTLFSASNT